LAASQMLRTRFYRCHARAPQAWIGQDSSVSASRNLSGFASASPGAALVNDYGRMGSWHKLPGQPNDKAREPPTEITADDFTSSQLRGESTSTNAVTGAVPGLITPMRRSQASRRPRAWPHGQPHLECIARARSHRTACRRSLRLVRSFEERKLPRGCRR